MNPQELKQALNNFIGTTTYYPMYPHVNLTDGTKFLCEQAQCFWLIDAIWSYQIQPHIKKELFQVYTLTVDLIKERGLLVCSDGNETELHRQTIDWTDFPLETVTLYYTDSIVLLPSEY